AADRHAHRQRQALPATRGIRCPTRGRGLVVHDRAALPKRGAGSGVPVDARPPPGAGPDRVAAVPIRDRGDGRLRRRTGDRQRAVATPSSTASLTAAAVIPRRSITWVPGA